MVGIKSVFRRATLRITNGDVSLESSIKSSYLLPIVCFTEKLIKISRISQEKFFWGGGERIDTIEKATNEKEINKTNGMRIKQMNMNSNIWGIRNEMRKCPENAMI